MSNYYEGKIESLRDLFGQDDVTLGDGCVAVGNATYPIVNDVIVLIEQSARDTEAMPQGVNLDADNSEISGQIQRSFGQEWAAFPDVLEEHQEEFQQYFDVVELGTLANKRVCDLGCGVGRWSYFLKGKVGELVLIDFSDSIFVARENLRDSAGALFFQGDLRSLPFRNGFADFIVCLGVLHHLPDNALESVRLLHRYAPNLLIYLYSALDRRPALYRVLLGPVTIIRRLVNRVENEAFRGAFSWFATLAFYLPLIGLGTLLRPFGIANSIPLYDFYHGKSLKRIRQDAYDRFFAHIEQRFTHKEIAGLSDTFSAITISPEIPYWHFRCDR